MITNTGLPSASDANASYTTPSGTLTAVRPGLPPLRPQQTFPQPHPYDRPTN